MTSQFPKWIELGALALALIAGFVNAVGLLSFEHQSVSHLSGTATMLGAGIISSPIEKSLHLLSVLGSFLFGSLIAGLLIRGETLKLGRHYDTALLIEAVMLFSAVVFLARGSIYGHFMASAACGLQNAIATKYSGAVIRTTHLTGIVTDLGIMLGARLRGENTDQRKLILFLIIFLGFISGGLLGSVLYQQYAVYALIVPTGGCLALSISYRLYYDMHKLRRYNC